MIITFTASLTSPQKLPVVSRKYTGRREEAGTSAFSSRGVDGDCMVVGGNEGSKGPGARSVTREVTVTKVTTSDKGGLVVTLRGVAISVDGPPEGSSGEV